MARNRIIRPSFFDDEKISQITRDARLLFIGMWKCSDDYGVVRGHPIWLKNNVFPYDDDVTREDMIRWLNELQSIGVILPFQHSGEHYFYIKNFTKHQKIDKPSKVRNPEPPNNFFTNNENSSETVASDSRDSSESSADVPRVSGERVASDSRDSGDEIEIEVEKEVEREIEILKAETFVSANTRKVLSKKFSADSPEYQLVDYIISLIRENHPRVKLTDSQIQKACADIEKLIRLDGWTLEEIKTVAEWATRDEFWKIQFQSPLKLRRKDRDGVTYMAKWWGILNNGNGKLKLNKEINPNILIEIYEEENKVLPPVVAVTEKRLNKSRERLIAFAEDHEQFLQKFREAVRLAQTIPFLTGKNKNGWKANFDWFVENDENFVKVLEGFYNGDF